MIERNLKRILFIRSDRLGEFLLSLPAIKLVKENYPQSLIYCLAERKNISLIEDIPFIDYFLEFKGTFTKGIKGALSLARLLKKEKFDCAVILNPHKNFHLATYLAKIPLRVGYNHKWPFFLNRKIEDKKFLNSKREYEYNIELVKLICKNIFLPKFELPTLSPSSLKFLENQIDLNKKYIVIHPFSSSRDKKIDLGFWEVLVDKLHKKSDIVLIGGEENILQSQHLKAKLGLINLVGKLNLKLLATFLKHNAFLVISTDSGPMHLAGILNIPTVGLFKVTSPQRWAPLGEKTLILSGKEKKDFINSFVKIEHFLTTL